MVDRGDEEAIFLTGAGGARGRIVEMVSGWPVGVEEVDMVRRVWGRSECVFRRKRAMVEYAKWDSDSYGQVTLILLVEANWDG